MNYLLKACDIESRSQQSEIVNQQLEQILE